MIARWSGKIKAGTTSEYITSFVDIMATAADLAKYEKPLKTDGISIKETLLGNDKEQKQHKYLYWSTKHHQAIRMGQWKAFRIHPDKKIELFNIEKDSYSKNNLADQYPGILRKMDSLFKVTHTDSEWYLNPGEPDSVFNDKKEKAKELGQIIPRPEIW